MALRRQTALALEAPLGASSPPSQFLSHFGVGSGLIRRTMDAALSRGGDHCDLYFEHKISSYIGVEDKAVNRAYTGVDFGVGIRVLKGDQTGYSFTEEITPKAMEQAAKTAANIADAAGRRPLNEMNISGNLKDLWKQLAATGSDPYPYDSWRIPALHFKDVQFSGL